MRRRLPFLTSLLLAACAAPPAPAPAPGPPLAPRLPDRPGLRNVARIAPHLYRGAQPDADGYRHLRQMGVRTVISFRRFFSARAEAEAAGLRYLSIPMMASLGSSPPTPGQLRLFFDTVLDPQNHPIYMHCKQGKDRTGMMAALYRIEREGWSNAQAIAEMQTFGFHDIFRDLIGFVRSYRRRGYGPQQ